MSFEDRIRGETEGVSTEDATLDELIAAFGKDGVDDLYRAGRLTPAQASALGGDEPPSLSSR